MPNYKLIHIRKDLLEMTQEQFAKEISIGKTQYSYKENGIRKIWILEAIKIKNVINRLLKEKISRFPELQENEEYTKEYSLDDIFLE